MMKTLFISLNSKYIHSSLAPWYFKAFLKEECGEVLILERTINDSLDAILADIYQIRPDVAAFSCYIWNLPQVLKLAANLKKVLPGVVIVLGGPEVSYEARELLKEKEFIDFIVAGEGEIALKQLLQELMKTKLETGIDFSSIRGLAYREKGCICFNGMSQPIDDLDTIPSPYTEEMLASLQNRIVYFESSRGCPFSCSYCLSSATEGVRYFSIERVKADLQKLVRAGVKQVKFVDRTFNCNKSRAKEILSYVARLPGDTNFHFEVAADLFDEEGIELVSGLPEGKVQFEIGVQTVNEASLQAVHRKTDTRRVLMNVGKLKRSGNVHLHLDLIAGLPYENHASFIESFNRVYMACPHQIQLGFLKLLKGSRLRKEAAEHGYVFRDDPPYEILSSRYMSYEELMVWKGIEELVERYYNSGKFPHSLQYMVQKRSGNPFDFYYPFYIYCKEKGFLHQPVPGRELYSILAAFAGEVLDEDEGLILNDLLKLDFLASDPSGSLPGGLNRITEPSFHERCFEFLKSPDHIKKYLPGFEHRSAKQIFKQVHFEIFQYDPEDRDGMNYIRRRTVLLFDYSRRDPVTHLYERHKVEI